jgi:hypothetical protein
MVAGRGSWGRRDKNEARTEGQKRAEEEKKAAVTTTSPCHHVHTTFCRGAKSDGNAHYYSFRQAWYVHGRP